MSEFRTVSRQSRPRPFLHAPLWGLVMGITSAVGIWLRGWLEPRSIADVVLMFALGGLFAWPVAISVLRILPGTGRRESALAASLIILGGTTFGVTGLLFAGYSQARYAESVATYDFYLPDFLLSTLENVAQFAVLGGPLFFPLGFVALLAASFWISARMR